MSERLSEFQESFRKSFYSPLVDRQGNYDFTDEEAQKVVATLRQEVDMLAETPKDPKKRPRFVDLRLLTEAVTEARVREIVKEHLARLIGQLKP